MIVSPLLTDTSICLNRCISMTMLGHADTLALTTVTMAALKTTRNSIVWIRTSNVDHAATLPFLHSPFISLIIHKSIFFKHRACSFIQT